MWKSVIVATATLAIAGSSIVYAQQHAGNSGRPGNDGERRFEHRHRPSVQDLAAFTDARIAALRAGLELTPDQAKNWPAYEQALREAAQLHLQQIQQHRAGADQQDQTPAATPFDRLARRAESMTKTGTALKHVADAGAPLYQSLDDAQKARWRKLSHMLHMNHHHHTQHAFNQQQEHGWRQGSGYGRGMEGRQFGPDAQGPDARMHRLNDEAPGSDTGDAQGADL